MQEIYFDKKVKLLDCPDVVVFSHDDEKLLVLRNIIKVDDIKDPISAIDEILKRVEHNMLLVLYQIAKFTNTTEFLTNIALRRGKFKKVGMMQRYPNYSIAYPGSMMGQNYNPQGGYSQNYNQQ